jgi:hypothetical protein
MAHLDDDTLALIAMAELSPADDERQHLATCPDCAASLAALRQTAELGRAARSVDLVEPADSVWGSIHATLGLSPQVAAVPRATDRAVTGTTRDGAVAPIADARRRRGLTWWPVAAAAAVVGLVGGVGAGIWWQSAQQAPAAVVAQAQLEPFPGWDATGVAKVEERSDGSRVVVVSLDSLPKDADLHEVWLIKTDASGLVSIGLLDGASGTFVVPAGVDLSEYALVDVSAEPDNGDPTHSGDSIVRGELHAT